MTTYCWIQKLRDHLFINQLKVESELETELPQAKLHLLRFPTSPTEGANNMNQVICYVNLWEMIFIQASIVHCLVNTNLMNKAFISLLTASLLWNKLEKFMSKDIVEFNEDYNYTFKRRIESLNSNIKPKSCI